MKGRGIFFVSVFSLLTAFNAFAQTETVSSSAVQDHLVQGYDSAAKMYTQTFANKKTFRTNVPNRMITSRSVVMEFDTGELIYTLTRDGEAMAYESGQIITEPG